LARASNTRYQPRLLARPRSTRRDVAERMNDRISKQMILMIADDYGRLAAAIEEETKATQKPK
jgi:hypothetical protein